MRDRARPAGDTAAGGERASRHPGLREAAERDRDRVRPRPRGKSDLWKYAVKDAAGKEVLLRKEKDLNGDGKIDTWEKYAPDGSLVRAVYDLDFDGKPDVTLFFEKDQLVKKELALGFDGVPRTWNYYEKGKLVRKERDTNGDGRVDSWEYWENGEIDRIGIDLDGDGQVDRWEARKRSEAAAAPAQPPQK